MQLKTNPRAVLSAFTTAFFVLLMGNIVAINMKFYMGHDWVYGLVPLFDFDGERNVPTLFSSVALMSCGALLGLIGWLHHQQSRSGFKWFCLGAIFLFLGVDEIAGLHELLGVPSREKFGTSGLLYYAWVIPYGAALLGLGIMYARWFFNLPAQSRKYFAFAGITFLSGAMGVEMISGAHAEVHGIENVTYALIYTIEESLEMLGTGIFLYALLGYLTTQFGDIKFTVEESPVIEAIPSVQHGTALPDMGR